MKKITHLRGILIIGKNFYNHYSLEIKKTEYINNSLIVKENYYSSLINSDYEHLYYIIKEYTNDAGLVNSIYFVLLDKSDEKKPEYLHRISMSEILRMNSKDIFYNWWEKIVKKLSNYETEEKKILLVIHLNENNIKKKFKINDYKFIYLQPKAFKKNKLFFKSSLYLFYNNNKNLLLLISILLNILFFIL